MSETKEKVKGDKIKGEIIYRDTYYIIPISYYRMANRTDKYGCSFCEKYEVGNLAHLIKHQQKCEGKI